MKRTIIIAEAGVNHNGSVDNAKNLIDVAAEAGADYVKFQTFKADKVASNKAAKASYQTRTTAEKESQLEMLKKLELNETTHRILIDYCREKGINFLSTPFDIESIDLIKKLGIKIGKIPSGEITNLPYLRKMAQSFEQLILSTGMSDMNEVARALEILRESGTKMENVIVLHCNTEYPTPMEDVNLNAMRSIANQLDISVGYSDHTLGIEVPIAAVALGACLIEKHFTLDRKMKGPDHSASLEPLELGNMVKAIRNIEKAIGTGIKEPSNSEIENIKIVRKSIVAAQYIKKGDRFTVDNITVKRPGTGVSPMEWDSVLGSIATRDFEKDEMISL